MANQSEEEQSDVQSSSINQSSSSKTDINVPVTAYDEDLERELMEFVEADDDNEEEKKQ